MGQYRDSDQPLAMVMENELEAWTEIRKRSRAGIDKLKELGLHVCSLAPARFAPSLYL
jgi:hypothetical protein